MALRATIYARQKKSFVSTWKTDNLSTGSSTATQVKLPLISSGIYNFNVNWGDGTSSTITVWNQAAVTHTYAIAGTYTIKITGTLRGWAFTNTGDRLKILSISSWGPFKISSPTAPGNFASCTNLNLTSVSDVLDLTGITDLRSMFATCTGLTTINRINEWNVSNITLFGGPSSGMFEGATNFNSNISNWNMSSAINVASMFRNCSFFNQNLNGWNLSACTSYDNMFQNAIRFNNGLAGGVSGTMTLNINTINNCTLTGMFSGASSFNQDIGACNTSKVTSMASMFENANSFNQNIGSWNVSNVSNFTNMFYSSTTSLFNNGNSASINNWNIKTTGSVSMNNMFGGNINASFNQPIGNWNMTAVTNTYGMFFRNGAFNQDLSNWERVGSTLANVIDMSKMFRQATSFNQNLNNWNVSKVTNFLDMFNGATAFNNGLAPGVGGSMTWTINSIGNVSMDSMFRDCINFNQNLSGWNMTKVNVITSMFFQASKWNNGLANGISGLLNWDISSITSLSNTFQGCSAFNQDISSWNTSNITNMNSTFVSCVKFNQNISSWNVSKVTSFVAMFQGTTIFQAPIGSWNINTSVGANVNMQGMFRSCPFNQPLNSWNVSKVTNMQEMFGANSNYNQPLDLWDVSSVTNMSLMFQSNTSFNRNIGAWKVSNVTNFTNFMNLKTPANYSAANLDAIYNGWIANPVASSRTISFNTIKYTAAATEGRALLSRANASKTITNIVNNGSGLIRITAVGHGLITDNKVFISAVTGTTEANGLFAVTVIDADTVDLQSSTFTNTYISGGSMRTGYGWAITDGGI